MAKVYRFELSAHEEAEKTESKWKCKKCGEDNATEVEKLTDRKLEMSILSQLFDLASVHEKKATQIKLCMDCVDQLENLPDDRNEITFTKEDYSLLETAIEKTAGARPIAWLKARKLWKQLAEPEEVEV